jgi:hypothetical protein
VVEYPAGKDQVKVRAVSPQVLEEIPTKEADSAEVEQLLDDQALQVGTRIGLDRDDLPRAEPLKHKRVSAFERAQLQHRPAFDSPTSSTNHVTRESLKRLALPAWKSVKGGGSIDDHSPWKIPSAFWGPGAEVT